MDRCLIIDDAPIVGKAASRILGSEGWTVETAHSGRHGLSVYGEFQPDLVLLDDWLPDMSSVEFLESLDQMTGGKLPLVFLMLIQVDPVPIMRAKRAGASGWILKPFDRAQLVDSINRNVERANRVRDKRVMKDDANLLTEGASIRQNPGHATPQHA